MSRLHLTAVAGLLLLAGCGGGEGGSTSRYTFAGGPAGGTFQYYGSGLASLLSDAESLNARVLARATGGSVENLRLVDAGDADFGVVYAGSVWLGRNGRLASDTARYRNVRAVAYLYDGPVHLVVRQGSGIEEVRDLVGRRVAVGNAGSGAASNAEILFRRLGMWDRIEREFLGYRNAAQAFQNGQIDAFWVLTGMPGAAVMEAALQEDIALLDAYPAAEAAGLFEAYPYYTRAPIPAGTYEGQDREVDSYSDAALWVASAAVPDSVVEAMLEHVFSDEGLSYLVNTHRSAEGMSVENGLRGVVTPVHPGAEAFWRARGVEIPAERMPADTAG